MLVRNIKYAFKKDHNVYIGRGDAFRKRSPLANPFYFHWRDDAERKESIEKYRVWLWKKIKAGDPQIWAELRKITPNSVLLCHCHPKPCHGYVVMKAWTWAYKQGLIEPAHSNHDGKTLEHIAHLNRKRLQAEDNLKYGPGRTRQEYMNQVQKKELELMAEASNALQQSLPPKKQQGRGAPRQPRGIVYIQPDIRYNVLDDMQADLHELHAIQRISAAATYANLT